jgi:hypothetical protein
MTDKFCAVKLNYIRELEATHDPAVWKKLAWLFDRVVKSLGGEVTADLLPKSTSLLAALANEKAEA